MKNRLTMRAPDLGYAARFLGIFLALGVFRIEGESTLPPQAGNADRWAADEFHSGIGKDIQS
jgi:hypothetical protein